MKCLGLGGWFRRKAEDKSVRASYAPAEATEESTVDSGSSFASQQKSPNHKAGALHYDCGRHSFQQEQLLHAGETPGVQTVEVDAAGELACTVFNLVVPGLLCFVDERCDFSSQHVVDP